MSWVQSPLPQPRFKMKFDEVPQSVIHEPGMLHRIDIWVIPKRKPGRRPRVPKPEDEPYLSRSIKFFCNEEEFETRWKYGKGNTKRRCILGRARVGGGAIMAGYRYDIQGMTWVLVRLFNNEDEETNFEDGSCGSE